MALGSIFKAGKKISIQVLKTSVIGMVFSVDAQNNALILRDFAICRILQKIFRKKGINEVSKVFFQNKQICIQHEKYGIIGVKAKSIDINKQEISLLFDVEMIYDKMASDRDVEIMNSIIKTTVGGVISFCSLGFLGGRLMYDGITEGFKENSSYQKNKAQFIGQNQIYSIKSLVDFDTSGKLIDFLDSIGGNLILDIDTDLHNLKFSSKQLSSEKLIEIKNNFIENTKNLIEDKSMGED